MLAPWWTKNRYPIGLDLGSLSVKMMQLERRGRGLSVLAAASGRLPEACPPQGPQRVAALAQLIRQLLESAPFSGRRVVSCLPATSVSYKSLRVPKMPPDELRAAVEWEAADRLGAGPDTTQFQFFDAGEVSQGDDLKEEIILLAASHAVIQEQVDALALCQLRAVAIDAVPGALARCTTLKDGAVEETSEDEDPEARPRVVVDVGYSSTKVVIVRAGRIVFFKLIDVGGMKFDQTVAQHLSLPLAEAAEMRRRLAAHAGQEESDEPLLFGATKRQSVQRAIYEAMRSAAGDLARELGLCLRYYSVTFRGRRPDTVWLVGGESADPSLARVLSDGAGVCIEPAGLLAGIDLSRAEELSQEGSRTLGAWAVAAGLSLRTEGRLPARGAA